MGLLMLSKKEQLKSNKIPIEVAASLVKLFHALGKLELIKEPTSWLKKGEVIHFCKRNLSASEQVWNSLW
jgi:hypothetical protein